MRVAWAAWIGVLLGVGCASNDDGLPLSFDSGSPPTDAQSADAGLEASAPQDAASALDASAPQDGASRDAAADASAVDAAPDAPACTPRTCESAGARCGTIDDGCGSSLPCGTCTGSGVTCVANQCICAPDSAELNNTKATARSLGMLTDAPPTSFSFTSYALGSLGDEDWYKFSVRDNCCDGSPIIQISLSGIPTGHNYDLGTYYDCDAGANVSECTAGEPHSTPAYGDGCRSTSSGSAGERTRIDTSCGGFFDDEHGTLYVRVHAVTWTPVCAAYTLAVESD